MIVRITNLKMQDSSAHKSQLKTSMIKGYASGTVGTNIHLK